MRNKIILIAIVLAGLVYLGASDKTVENQPPEEPGRSEVIFDAVDGRGIEVTDAYTTNGSEIKRALGLDESNIKDDSEIAFVIFRYSAVDGIDSKLKKVLNTLYATLQVDADIDGVLVMAYDPADITGKGTLVYTNRSYAEGLILQNLTLRRFYNRFDIYPIKAESNEN